jgi:hypothetical protein
VLCALGLRTLLRGEKAGTWGPILVGIFGIGMIMAGLFRPDPMPGVDAGTTVAMTASGALHMVGFFMAFPALIAACFVFARRFKALRQKGWAIYSAGTGIAVPVICVGSALQPAWVGVIMAGAGLVLFAWLGAIASQVLARPFAMVADLA